MSVITSPDPYDVLGEVRSLVARGDVEQATLRHIQTWFVPYIAEVERQKGLESESLATPKSYDVRRQFDRPVEDGIPYIVVVSPGTSSGKPPRRDGDGSVRAWWFIAVGALVEASDQEAAKALAGYYGAAIRGLMTQIPELGDYEDENGLWRDPFSADCQWEDERYDDTPVNQERHIATVRATFTVEVDDVVNVFGGFRDLEGNYRLPSNPYKRPAPYPRVQRIDVDVYAKKPSKVVKIKTVKESGAVSSIEGVKQ